MNITTSRFDDETLVPTSAKTKTRRVKRSRADLLATPEVDHARRIAFESLAVSVREELSPRGALESIYVERAVIAAWRLNEAIEAERAGVLGGLTIGGDSTDLFDGLADGLRREADRAERSLRRVLDSLRDLRDPARSTWGHAAHPPTPVSPIADEPTFDEDLFSNEWPALPIDSVDMPVATESASDDAPLPRWQDRLVFDFNVSDRSPVVQGTWVTVAQIVNLIVDGSTWADILRSHPELTEDDIRLCLAYAMEQENDCDGNYQP